MASEAWHRSEPTRGILDPVDRISEILFGVIMTLTFTCTLGVATADNMQIRAMLIGALGCNLAWGIIDGGVYLMARVSEAGRSLLRWRAVRGATDAGAAQRVIADALPPLLASALTPAQLDSIRQTLDQLPEPRPPRLTGGDFFGALGICLLSFLSTFPIVTPFLLIGDARLALRASNVVAIVMLFACGYAVGRLSGFRPVATGLSMVGIGVALVGVAIALGG
jgi:VIT1/CCC1 family predicted Fe2+/Mn2+ transporter